MKKKISNLFGNNNNKQLAKNINGSVVIKGLAIMVSFFTLPAYLNYFSDETVLGIWFTVISILGWIMNFDLGIGNGLRNNLVRPLIKNKSKIIKSYISSAYILIGIISILLITIGIFTIELINWNTILKIDEDLISSQTLESVIKILFIGVMIQFFLKLIVSILYSMQRTVMPSILTLISTVSLLLFITYYKSEDVENSIMILAFANVVTLNLPTLLASIILFNGKLKKSKPSPKYYVKRYARNVVNIGGTFFLIQLALMLFNSTNLFLITWFYGANYVVEYQIYFRIFHVFVTFFSIITNPVWSAVSKAFVEKRFTWISKLYKYLNFLVLIGLCGMIIVVISLQSLVDIWLGDNSIDINYMYASLFALESIILMHIMASTSIANGIGSLKLQLIYNVTIGVLKVPILIIMNRFYDDWIGLVVVNVILLLPCAVIQSLSIYKEIKVKRERNFKEEEKNV